MWARLIKSLAIGDSCEPLLSRGWGGGAESSNPLITGLVSLATSPNPEAIQESTKNYFISINSGTVERGLILQNKRGSYHPYHSENSKGFRSSWARNWG